MVVLTQSGGVIWLIVLLYDRPADELDEDWGILDVTVVALLIQQKSHRSSSVILQPSTYLIVHKIHV